MPTGPSAKLIKREAQGRLQAAEALLGNAEADRFLVDITELGVGGCCPSVDQYGGDRFPRNRHAGRGCAYLMSVEVGHNQRIVRRLSPPLLRHGFERAAEGRRCDWLPPQPFLKAELQKGDASVQHVREVVDALISEVDEVDALPYSTSLREFAQELHVACEALKGTSDPTTHHHHPHVAQHAALAPQPSHIVSVWHEGRHEFNVA